MLGWFLGKRYRSIRDTLVPFRKDQGRGDLAARLIEIAPDFKKVRSVFNDCRYDANPRGLDLLYSAMVDRLRKEGVNPETRSFFIEEKIQDLGEKEIDEAVSEFEEIHLDDIEHLPRDLFPLIDGVEIAWTRLKKESRILRESGFEGHLISRFFANEMFDGSKNGVSLYAVRPPLKTPEIINNSHEYSFNDDGMTAVHAWDETNILVSLQVRRSHVRKWVKYYLDKVDEELEESGP